MRYLVRAAAVGAVILATVGGALAADVVAERKEAMKANGAAMKAIKAAVEGGKAADAVAGAGDQCDLAGQCGLLRLAQLGLLQ